VEGPSTITMDDFVRCAADARRFEAVAAESDHPDLKVAQELSAALPQGGPFG